MNPVRELLGAALALFGAMGWALVLVAVYLSPFAIVVYTAYRIFR